MHSTTSTVALPSQDYFTMVNKPSILIVEDDQLMINMYGRIFKLYGFTPITLVGNGKEALDKLVDLSPAPSIILLDMMMPKMNGFEVLKHLKHGKNKKKWKDIPIVVLSNLSGQDDIKKALELGAALYLIKSENSPKQVAEKVKQFFIQ